MLTELEIAKASDKPMIVKVSYSRTNDSDEPKCTPDLFCTPDKNPTCNPDISLCDPNQKPPKPKLAIK